MLTFWFNADLDVNSQIDFVLIYKFLVTINGWIRDTIIVGYEYSWFICSNLSRFALSSVVKIDLLIHGTTGG